MSKQLMWIVGAIALAVIVVTVSHSAVVSNHNRLEIRTPQQQVQSIEHKPSI